MTLLIVLGIYFFVGSVIGFAALWEEERESIDGFFFTIANILIFGTLFPVILFMRYRLNQERKRVRAAKKKLQQEIDS